MKADSIDRVEFCAEVRENIDFINEIFTDLGALELFENPDVTFIEAWIFETLLAFTLFRANNSVTLDFHLMPDGIRIDFEGYNEAYEVGNKDLRKDRDSVFRTIKTLLCEPIMVEYKGNAMFVNLFNSDGSRYAIWSLGSIFTLITGHYLKSQAIKQHLFSPIYPKN